MFQDHWIKKEKKKGKVRGYKETKLDSNLVFNGNMQIC